MLAGRSAGWRTPGRVRAPQARPWPGIRSRRAAADRIRSSAARPEPQCGRRRPGTAAVTDGERLAKATARGRGKSSEHRRDPVVAMGVPGFDAHLILCEQCHLFSLWLRDGTHPLAAPDLVTPASCPGQAEQTGSVGGCEEALDPGRQIVSQDSPNGVSRFGIQAGTQALDHTPRKSMPGRHGPNAYPLVTADLAWRDLARIGMGECGFPILGT
jgi:hypothetical protein